MRSTVPALVVFTTASICFAEPEPLPMPRTVEPAVEVLPAPLPVGNAVPVLPPTVLSIEMGPLGPAMPGFWRKSQYGRWQEYAVDEMGFWRPRVVLAPQPYYLYNGMPFPWLSTKPTEIIPPGRH